MHVTGCELDLVGATPLNEAFDRGGMDLAVFITEASAQQGMLVGSLPLVWWAAAISLTARARHGADQKAVKVALRVLNETLGLGRSGGR